MAIRTSQDKVKAVLLANYNGRADLTPFIGIASRLVDRVVSKAATNGEALTTAEALDVETLLAAHLYCCSDRTYRSRSTLSAAGAFDGSTAMGLDATIFGQQAKVADPSGWLEGLAEGAVASCDWMGRDYVDQLTYEERNGVVG